MARVKFPVTPAIRALRAAKVDFTPRLYDYVPKGGTAASAAALGVDEHQVIKTLIMADDAGAPLVVLMHGDKQVSTKNLARQIGCRAVDPCPPEVAQKHTGYMVGGTSPFGTRKTMPVYVEASILELEQLIINGGKRGFLVEITPQVLVELLSPTTVEVAI
ncbi:MAG: Cys-tRNA(Pro) deacylase [Bradymonadia bacterium]